MTREANVGEGCAVNSASRALFSANTFCSAGRAWLASMRPNAGSDSNSSSGVFTPGILSDVRQYPGECRSAADEPADASQRTAPESLRERGAVGRGQQKRPAVRGFGQHIQGGCPRVGGAPIEHLLESGRAGLLPLRGAQRSVMVGIEARQQACLVLLP